MFRNASTIVQVASPPPVSALSHFKSMLLAKRTQMLSALSTLRGGSVGRAEASAEHFGRPEDPVTDTLGQREFEFAMDAMETEELMALDAAIRRIEQGSFGLCVDCGEHIGASRLQATPEVARCLTCQRKLEAHQSAAGAGGSGLGAHQRRGTDWRAHS